ncbi:hypothetical protein SAMN05216319_3654 [Duganella sp. CF402]|uniref:hypothetical protein n=1 Tax=unclassified Duganella TaxID=2636909 RepID=UPI0008B9A9CA|nr:MULTISPECIES: hypothetical protein [unclassified Duganella]RZT04560.1 hypothetical protein EV582_5451 [Duganella sp. BK701]SEM32142.1 hypothetical protein SAMN05216319_3654 [Duganella sp. CF402]
MSNPVTLRVSFDAEQISSKLNWVFIPESRPNFGTHAGSILLAHGEVLTVEVVGNGLVKPGGFSGFELTECCLFTRPQVTQVGKNVPTMFAPPSPFLGVKGACYIFSGQSERGSAPPPLQAAPEKWLTVVETLSDQLVVGPSDGRWEMSFMLTVSIQWNGAASTNRVFYFDPESEVGDGGHPSNSRPPL